MSDGAPRPPAPADHAGTDPVSSEDLGGAGAETDRDASSSSHAAALPASRIYDPPPSTLLQAPKETWEPQQRATRRPDFADRVAHTAEVWVDPDAPAPPKPPPRRTGAITWDDDKSAALRMAPPALGQLSRGQVFVLAALSALVAVLAVAWAIKSLGLWTGGPPGTMAAAAPVAGQTDAAPLSSLSEEDYQEAVTQATKFLDSPSLDELMPVIRDPQRVRPLMDEFYKEEPWRPFLVREVSPRDLFQTKNLMLAGMVELGDFGKRAIAFLRTSDGIKVDWESFVGFGEIPWDRLAAERPTRPVLMRVHLIPDDYYNFDFTDSRIYACYRMLSHGGVHRLYGYVKRDQPLYGRLVVKTQPNTFTMPTVRFRFKEAGLSSDQVEITELVSDGWLVTDEDLPPAAVPAPASPPATR